MASNYIDPAFQIGMMLGDAYGNMWAANAKKRQGAKADDIIEQMQNQRSIQRIADARRAGISDEDAVQVITNKIAQQAGAQGATQATGMGQLNQPGIDFMGMGAQMAEPQDPYKLSVPSPLDQLKGAGGKEYSINKALQANQNALNKEKEAQALLASNPTAQAAYNWNPDYTEDNVRKALRKAGLAKDVIDEKVGEVKSDIAKRAEEVLLPSIQKKMFYGYDTVEKGEDGNLYPVHHDPDAVSFMQAMAELETLKQYSPDTYKTYASQIVGPLALHDEKVADKRYDKQVKVARENAVQNRAWNLEDKAQNFQERVYFAGLKSKNGKYSISTADYKEAQKRAGEIEAYYQEHKEANPNFQLPPSMQEEWEESRAMIKQYRRERIGKTGNGQDTNNHSDVSDSDKQGVDWNDWNSINAGINQALKDGYTAKDILKLAAERLGTDHPWYKIIASSFDHEGAKRRKEEEAAARQKRLNETLYPGTNDVNTVDQTIAKIAEIGSDIANGRPLWNLAHGK